MGKWIINSLTSCCSGLRAGEDEPHPPAPARAAAAKPSSKPRPAGAELPRRAKVMIAIRVWALFLDKAKTGFSCSSFLT